MQNFLCQCLFKVKSLKTNEHSSSLLHCNTQVCAVSSGALGLSCTAGSAQYFASSVVLISKSSQCAYATTQSSAEAYSGMPIGCVHIMCPYLHYLEIVFGYV